MAPPPPTPAMILQQVKEFLRTNRPDDAQKLIAPLVEQNDRKAWRLLPDVIKAFAERGERYLRGDDVEAAWVDLLRAETLDDKHAAVVQLRETLTRLGLASAKASLENGKPLPAVHQAILLRERKVRHADLATVQELASDWIQAQEQADRGDFLLAFQSLDRIRNKKFVPPTGLDRFIIELEGRHTSFRDAIGRMQDALESRSWAEVLRTAEEATAAAPMNREAQQARTRAWEMLKPVPAPPGQFNTLLLEASDEPTDETLLTVPPTTPTGPLKRFLLWIDGVGGYLVCLSSRITFGQAIGDGPIDVPLFADVSRMHATLTRDDEGYLLEASRPVQVNGSSIDKTLLHANDRITLGATCQFLFKKPLMISPTAQLTLTSGHRLPLGVDGVLLMAEKLILGPPGQSHIPIPGLMKPVILMKQGTGLAVSHAGEYHIDGKAHHGQTPLQLPTTVEGDSFVFAVELVPVK